MKKTGAHLLVTLALLSGLLNQNSLRAAGPEKRSDVFGTFSSWTNRFHSAAGDSARAGMISEGLALAKQRHAAMAEMVKSDPARALALAVPDAARQQLPQPILDELETPISGIGDLSVRGILQRTGGPRVKPMERVVRLNGKTYPAYVYGKRIKQYSQKGVPLEGILVDGALALSDVTVTAAGDAIGSSGNPPSAWTTGLKKVLVIRVDFSDLPGDPVGWADTTPLSQTTAYTADYVQDVADNRIAPFYKQSSYGLTTLQTTVSEQVYRMPQTANDYATTLTGNDQLHIDAESAAAADYNLADFDRVAVLFSFLGNIQNSYITYGGLAELVNKRIWLNGEFDFRVVTHEIGHTYGLLHAGLWMVNDDDPISANGMIIEYGDDFDTMGANYANDARTDFNPYYKNILGWIPDSKVKVAETNSNYRIYAFDTANYLEATNNSVLAVKFVKDAQRTYWIGARRNFTDNDSMHAGAYVIWGFDSVGSGGGGGYQSGLLDLTTPGKSGAAGGASDYDAALGLKTKFQDPAIGLLVTPVGGDNSTLNGYLDIQFGLGSSLSVLTNQILGGNGNGLVDFNECNNLQIVLTNAGVAVSNVTVSISTTTPKTIVAQGFSLYPDIPNGGTAANLIPFKLSTAPDFVCGTPVDIELVVRTASKTLTNFLRLPSGTLDLPLRYTNETAVAIPDANPAGAVSSIDVSNFNSVLGNVSVAVHLTHSYDFDLQLELIGPDGTSVLLSKNNGGAGHDYGFDCSSAAQTVFDDSALLPIGMASAPFVGTFRPEQPLSAFNLKYGASVNGTWQLRVVDSKQFMTGTIECWTLALSPEICHDGGGECPGSDLALNVFDSPDPVVVGSNLTYTITVTNSGPSTAKAVILSQTLPEGTTFVSVNTSQGTSQHSGGAVTCNFGTVAPASAVTATVVVTPTLEGILNSTVTIGSSQADPNPANNSVNVATRVVPPSADLSVTVLDAPDPIYAGGQLTYTIAVTNRGPTMANAVVLTNVLPGTAILLSATATQGSYINAGGTIIYNIGALPSGGDAVVTLVVQPTVVGALTEISQVGSEQTDLFPANNIATAITTVGPAADLALTIADSPDPVVTGSNITYVIILTNRGPNTADNVVINGTLPASAVFVTNTVSQGTFSLSGTTFVANIGSLTSENSATLTISMTAPNNSQTVILSATASATQADPDFSNNSAASSTLVANPFVSIVPAGAVLTAESFTPANGTVDSGETVTVKLRLRNAGNVDTTNLVASLISSAGITSLSAPQNYGVLAAGGSAGENSFNFTASGNNGQTITATLQLQDGGGVFTNVDFSFTLPNVNAFSNTTAIVIPDSGPANLYPSQITVSNVTGLVDKITVTLNKMNHTYPDDLDVLLVDPAGRKVLLMGDAGGGNQLSGVNLTFDPTAESVLADEDQLVSGSVVPANYSPDDDVFTNAPAGPYPSALDIFDGTNPNGTWSLYVVDDSSGDQGNIAGGWTLSVTTVSPVNKIAGLSIVPTNTSSSVLLNGNASYTFIISNSGPDEASNVIVNNPLPPNCTAITPTSFNIGTLGVGSNATVSVTLIPSAVGLLTNTAIVSAGEIDLNLLNNSASAVTAVGLPDADLAMLITAPTNPIVGNSFTYTVTVTNRGPDSALNVVVTNTLPTGTSFVSATASQGACSNLSGVVTCDLGNVGANNSVVISITAIPLAAGNLTNNASVAAIANDPNLANNAASFVSVAANPTPVLVASGATLISESALANGVIDPGESVQIAFALANIGSADTTNLVATLQASGGVNGSSAQNYGAVIHDGAAVSKTFSFTVSASLSGPIVATLQLQDGAKNLGSVTFSFDLANAKNFANSTAIVIPPSGPATPYPSTITITNLTGLVSKVAVTLNGLKHSFPDDLDVLLVSPNGEKVLLMSDVGGSYSVSGVALTFDDAGAPLPDAAQIVSGTFRPTNFETNDAFVAVPSGTMASSLAVFKGGNPNGTWSLYVTDDTGGDSGEISGGWNLEITIVNTINPAANLLVSMNAPASAGAGDAMSYTLSVSNAGPASASGVVLLDALPANFTFNSALLSQGSYTVNSGVVTCDLGTINSGSSAIVTLTGTPNAVGTITNTASVTANETDLYVVNNSASAITTIISITPSALGSAQVMSNGNFQLTINGSAGATYRIEASSDLLDWIPVQTNECGLDGAFQFTDNVATNYNPRFYRAVRLP